MNLDDLAAFAAVDTADALSDVEGYADQWRAAAVAEPGVAPLDFVDGLVIAGMGGSGIVGDVVATLAASVLDVPVLVRHGSTLPAWVGASVLVVAVSHSGSTEETVTVAREAAGRGCAGLVVCSGGALADVADDAGWPAVHVPAGGQPRHQIGWLAVPVLRALGLHGGLEEAIAVLADGTAALGRAVPSADNPAKHLAQRIAQQPVLPVVYGTDGLAGVAARRLVKQLAENAKLPALDGEVPELCHNAVVGWQGATLPWGLVWLRDPAGENPRDARRCEVLPDLLPGAGWSHTVTARGTTPLARLASLLHTVDLVSVYTALALDRDPTPITAIEHLKEALAR